MSNQPQAEGQFKKDLRKIDIWSLALGAIIGWGCFVLPGTDFLPKAGPLGAILGLLLGAVIISIISFSYGYMIQKFPLSGGEFVYSDSAFGKKHAFVCGWSLVLAYWSLIPLNSTAVAMVSRYILPGSPFQFGYLYTIAHWDVYIGEILLAYGLYHRPRHREHPGRQERRLVPDPGGRLPGGLRSLRAGGYPHQQAGLQQPAALFPGGQVPLLLHHRHPGLHSLLLRGL